MDSSNGEEIPMKGSPDSGDAQVYSKTDKLRSEQVRIWKRLTLAFCILFMLALIAFIVVLCLAINGDIGASKASQSMSDYNAESKCTHAPKPMNEELARRSNAIFSGLTKSETEQVISFLMSQEDLNLVPMSNASIGNNYIYTIETYLPSKSNVTDWLDMRATDQPTRKARAILFMGETQTVLDYIISPIPNPSTKEVSYVNRPQGQELTWKSRPICNTVEEPLVYSTMMEKIIPLATVIRESFAPSCVNLTKCVHAMMAVRSVLNSPKRHLYLWFFAVDSRIEDYYLYAIPFYVVMSSTGTEYDIEKISYNNVEFQSNNDLIDRYDNEPNIRYTLPDISKNIGRYGSPRYLMDGVTADQTRRPPSPIYPDGPRFRVDSQHVSWLKWSFNIHPRTVTGAQLFDVKFDENRIAYEISMQDILVVYAGDAPDDFFRSYFDNGWAVGTYNMPLIRNVDCPPGAVYLSSNIYGVSSDKAIELKDAFCVFEHRNSIPLRRHFSTEFTTWGYRYAFSMPDTVLIVRQIITVWNYDYIFDYEFHQNGMVEAKVSSTGYIAVSPMHSGDVKHGFVVNPDWNARGNLHQHLFNFKLDVDVAGVSNRFKTLNIKSEPVTTSFAADGEWSQMSFDETLISREGESALRYDFDSPKYYLIQNFFNNVYPKADNPLPQSYRIVVSGFSKVVLADDSPLMAGAASWAKYQLAVTKQSEAERATSSYFVQGDPFDAAVNFDTFLANNDNLIDEDLVVWATVGIHHIPTYEDLPVTTTPGKTVGVALSPFNYFKRDPSIHSRDAALFWNKDMFMMDNEYLAGETMCPANFSKPELSFGR